jgi:hypothetical protein
VDGLVFNDLDLPVHYYLERGSRNRSQYDHITAACRPPIVKDTYDNPRKFTVLPLSPYFLNAHVCTVGAYTWD